MQRDRLAAFREGHQQRQQQGHELMNVQGGDYTSQLHHDGSGNGATDPMKPFFDQVTAVQNDIARFSENVSQIAELHSRTLNSADDNASRQNAAVLDELVEKTRKLSNELKGRIQTLTSFSVSRLQDQAIRRNQTTLLRQRFVETLQNYQQVERDYRQKYRQRVERQFKIVKPDATQEEVEAVVNNTDGTGVQIFTQALSSSTRYGESRQAYKEVQDRHQDIQKIERTLEELAQLFNDMALLIAQQDEAIDQIQTVADTVEADTRHGLDQTEKAVKSARSARRKRWICFGIFVFVIAVLALVLGLYFGLRPGNKSSSN